MQVSFTSVCSSTRNITNYFCRVRFFSKEIILFREDLQQKMRRHCLVQPNNTFQIHEHLVTTIIANEHLCPLPLTAQPIYWQFDAALRLHPTPDAIVLADKCEAYEARREGSLCFNPSAFPIDYCFVCYKPLADSLDWKKIPSGESIDDLS